MDQSLYYMFTRLDTKVSVMVKRGLDAPRQMGGGGRWTTVNRPRRTSITVWDGDDPYQMDVPILFDGFLSTGARRSQENAISIINQMKFAPSDFTPPPQVQIAGVLPVKGATWIVQNIDYGDNVYWHPDGYRLRQDAVLHLLQYIAPDQLSIRPSAVSHIHRVVAGETLASIAKQEYGDAGLAGVLKQANNIRDPKKLPKTLVIPPLVGH